MAFVQNKVSPSFPDFGKKFEFVYCFDVFVHVDMHCFYQQLINLKPHLCPTAKIFLSVADITSTLGFDRFKKQKSFKVSGFCFMSPDIAKKIVDEAGYKII